MAYGQASVTRNGLIVQQASLVFTTPVIGVASGTSLTLSSLTSGRVPFATTAGLLTDSAALTFNSGTGALSATSFIGAGTGLTGTAASLTAGNVTTNANLTGPVTSTGNATALSAKADVLEAAIFAADAGSTDDYVITLSPAISAYVTGAHYWFKANTANTGAATLNINGLGAKTIVKVAGGITTALATNDIRAGQWCDVVYDGTNMQIQSTLGNAAAGDVTLAAGNQFTGINQFAGSEVTNANAMGALAIDVTKGLNTKSVSVDSTFTFSGTPATANTWFSIFITNTDSASHVMTIPSSISLAAGATVTTVTLPASGYLQLTWRYDGTNYFVYGDGTNAVSDTAYASSWNGVTGIAPSKNAVYDAFGAQINYPLTVYGVGTAYSLTNTAAAVTFGTTSPAKVLDKAGTYLVLAQINLAYTGATVVAETATIKVRRTNNTAADVSVLPVLDLPVSTTLTNTYGIFQIPPFIYTTANIDDSLSIFANVSAGLGAGTIDATAIGTSLVCIKLY